MNLQKITRKTRILPVVVFCAAFAVLTFATHLLYQNQAKDEQLRAVYTAESTVGRVSSQLNQYLSESNFIKKLIESGYDISGRPFAVISGHMQEGKDIIKAHELAKDGIVSQVYPILENQAAIGLDMLENPARKKEATLAKESGEYTIAGPFELAQGGTGALLFDPIYTTDATGLRDFWGFSILVLRWDQFMDEIELNKLEEAGYRYQIWKKDLYTEEKVVIAESEGFLPNDALEVTCSVPNDTWYFEIVPAKGWVSPQQMLFGLLLSVVISGLLAYGCWQFLVREEQDALHEAALEKSAQEAREANEAKTRFLFNMSHDIRTPMNAIIGFSDLLEKHIDEREKVLDYTKKIKSSSSFLLSLINYVLEMARIESGKTVLKEEVGDLQIIANTLSDVFEPSVRQKNLTCTCRTDLAHPYVICDRTKLREILLNIISNAIKYTPEGGHIAVSISETPCEQAGTGRYTLRVQDDGIGMSEDYLPHIFEEFSREHTSTESKVVGTGLGLPIVKALVDRMHGTIDVQSKIGCGTTMTVTLPLPLASEEQVRAYQQPVEEQLPADLKGRRILLAEDNDLNAEIAMTLLQENGLEVERAADGLLCVAALQNHPADYYDAILMDIQMPHMNGYQATQTIRSLRDPRRNIPIIAMTANAFDEDHQKALEVGMNEHLAKPIDLDALFKTLERVLK